MTKTLWLTFTETPCIKHRKTYKRNRPRARLLWRLDIFNITLLAAPKSLMHTIISAKNVVAINGHVILTGCGCQYVHQVACVERRSHVSVVARLVNRYQENDLVTTE